VGELSRKLLDAYKTLNQPVPAVYKTQLKLELANGSRVVFCLVDKRLTDPFPVSIF
jgi:hypothetical protein